jgi:hypothetical protein
MNNWIGTVDSLQGMVDSQRLLVIVHSHGYRGLLPLARGASALDEVTWFCLGVLESRVNGLRSAFQSFAVDGIVEDCVKGLLRTGCFQPSAFCFKLAALFYCSW